MTTTIHHHPARSVADVTGGTILATVDIAAPPERVFRALSSEEITQWWGAPAMYQTTEWTGDVRPGGRWVSRGKGADGSEFSVEGEYVEVSPPHKLVHTWIAAWDGGNVTTVTYLLAAVAGGTRLTLRHDGFAGRPESCAGHSEGWERVLGWLRGFTAGAPKEKKYFFCRLVPPRPTFAMEMSAAERAAMLAHGDYWRKLTAEGVGVVLGPVMDPAGPWGLGVVRVDDEKQLAAIWEKDPAITAGMGMRLESMPLMSVIAAEAE